MTSPKTSPLPWSLAVGHWNTKNRLIDSNGHLVTQIEGPNPLIDETNARFIVTAVNSHAALLAAAKSLMDSMKLVGRVEFGSSAAETLKSAIATAEKPTS
jgi:hypothetical protein